MSLFGRIKDALFGSEEPEDGPCGIITDEDDVTTFMHWLTDPTRQPDGTVWCEECQGYYMMHVHEEGQTSE